MSLIPVLNDLHWGCRNGHNVFEKELQDFLTKTFFPWVDSNDVKYCIIAGDVFDERRSVLVKTLNHSKNYLFDELEKRQIETYIIPGNHDIAYKNTLYPNSLQPILSYYKHLHFIDNPTILQLENCSFRLIPWICSENEIECLKSIEEGKENFLVTHLDILGSQSVPGIFLTHGFETKVFQNYENVLNGHIHTRSYFDNIINLGTQYQMNWSDFGQQKGFHIIDAQTRDLDFIENPSVVYEKFYYDQDLVEGVDPLEWIEYNKNRIQNKYVKIVIGNKKNNYTFEKFCDKISNIGAYEVSFLDNIIVDAFDETLDEETILNNSKSTMHIMKDYIDCIETNLNKDILFQLSNQLYQEALNKDIFAE